MTSKEALKNIKEWVEYFADWKNLKHSEKNEFEEALSVIAKDLEVLDILKRLNKIIVVDGTITPEELDQIKERLGDE